MVSAWQQFLRSSTRQPRAPGHLLTLPARLPFAGPDAKVLYLTDPLTVGGVASSDAMKIFGAVYAAVRGSSPVPQ
jgi:hypothetical protein